MISVLFVCMGNICRSPMAEGAFRRAVENAGLAHEFDIDSAGTIGYHAGSKPDPRAQVTAMKHGINISDQRSRKVTDTDFTKYDYILAMDFDNLADLKARCPQEYQNRISLFLSHAPSHAPSVDMDEMPDPYYGHDNQFDMCFEAATEAADGLLAHITDTHFKTS